MPNVKKQFVDLTKKPNLKNFSKKRKIIILLVFLLVAAGGIYFFQQRSQEQAIRIGDITITEKDIDEFVVQMEEYSQQNPNSAFEGDFRQQALDDLVTNAALKKEAKDRSISIENDELVVAMGGEESDSATQKRAYITQLRQYNKMRQTRIENVAYQDKLNNDLLLERDLLVVTTSFATPFFSRASESEVATYYEQARKNMVDKIAPLVESGASREEIAKQVDRTTYSTPSDELENSDPYFEGLVVLADYKEGVPAGEKYFNDLDDTDYIRGEVGTLESTNEKVAQLKEVGDTTGLFTAKIGAFAIIRLEAKTGGEYNSWNDFLDSYKREYVEGAVDFIKAELSFKAKDILDKAAKAASSIGTKKAKAHSGSHANCGSGHHVKIWIRALNVDNNTEIEDAKVNQKQASNRGCPSMNDTITTNKTSFVRFSPDAHCFNGRPVWTLEAEPAGFERVSRFIASSSVSGKNNMNYEFSGQRGDNTPSGSGLSKYRTGGPSGTNRWGFPDSWIPESANNAENIYITLRYKEKKPDAACVLFRVLPVAPLPNNGVKAGTNPFGLQLQFENTGGERFGGGTGSKFSIKISASAGNEWLPIKPTPISNGVVQGTDTIRLISGSPMDPGDKRTIGFQLSGAPNVITSATLRAELRYDNKVLRTCTTPVQVFTSSSLDPDAEANFSGDNESPGGVNFKNIVKNQTTTNRTATNITGKYTWKRNGVTQGTLRPDFTRNNVAINSGDEFVQDVFHGLTAGSYQAGDQFCTITQVTPGVIWTGQHPTTGATVTAGNQNVPAQSEEKCATLVNKPYLKVYGNDVSAGGGFLGEEGNCGENNEAGIYTYARGRLGSGAQFAAFALTAIDGFGSSSLVGSDSRRLSFSNTQNINASDDPTKPHYGGMFGGSGHCATNFMSLKSTDAVVKTVQGISATLTNITSGSAKEYYYEGLLELFGNTNFSGQKTLYVKGDVFITSNITYSGRDTGWSSRDSIPNFSLIVDGNIYINSTVTQLDGLYVAQGEGSGNIYTCADSQGPPGFVPRAPGDFWSNCRSQLRVYGSFVANQVHFLRAGNSLRNSSSSEGAPSNASEVFMFSPEAYLSKPGYPARSGPGIGTYDYITTLPPVL